MPDAHREPAQVLVDMIAAVRRMCGDPDTTELPDATITAVLGGPEVLDWINHRRPSEGISYLITIANQQDYDSKPSGSYHVTDVWWMTADFEWFSPSMEYTPEDHDLNVAMAGFNVLDNPAMVQSFYRAISEYRGSFSGRGYEIGNGKIRLTPCPTSGGDKVYFRYTTPRWTAITSVATEYVTAVEKEAAACCLDMLALKRGMVRSGRSFSGGGGEREKERAKELHEEAEAAVPLLTCPFGRG